MKAGTRLMIGILLILSVSPVLAIERWQDLQEQSRVAKKAGDYPKAASLASQALTAAEEVETPESATLLPLLMDLVALYKTQGWNREARPLLEKALDISRIANGPEHAETVKIADNLMKTYEQLGEKQKAAALGYSRVADLAFAEVARWEAEKKAGALSPTPQQNIAKPEARLPLEIESHDLAKDYYQNEIAADLRYKGKYIGVNGKAGEIGKDSRGSFYVTFEPTDKKFPGIRCYLPKSEEAKISRLKRGDWALIVGRILGMNSHIVMVDCGLMPGYKDGIQFGSPRP